MDSRGRGTSHARQDHAGVALWNRAKNQALWEAGFEASRKWGSAMILQEGVIGLFE